MRLFQDFDHGNADLQPPPTLVPRNREQQQLMVLSNLDVEQSIIGPLRGKSCHSFQEESRNKSMVLFQIASDIHLEVNHEYASYNIPAAAPYLILAGDIGQLSEYEEYLSFLERHTKEFKLILLVLGNHEFYGADHPTGVETARKLVLDARLDGKVVFLDGSTYHVADSDISVLGCTLWTSIPDDKVETVMSRVKDYQYIKDWSAQVHNQCHDRDLTWLQNEVGSIYRRFPERKLIIVTHHAPCSNQTSKPQYANNPWNCAFASDIIQSGTLPGVYVWVFGHTHYSTDFFKDGIRVIANQRGYKSTAFTGSNANRYNATKTIEV